MSKYCYPNVIKYARCDKFLAIFYNLAANEQGFLPKKTVKYEWTHAPK